MKKFATLELCCSPFLYLGGRKIGSLDFVVLLLCILVHGRLGGVLSLYSYPRSLEKQYKTFAKKQNSCATQ